MQLDEETIRALRARQRLGVSPEATMTGTSGSRPRASRIISISCLSAPDAMATGTAAAASRRHAAAPGNSTSPLAASC